MISGRDEDFVAFYEIDKFLIFQNLKDPKDLKLRISTIMIHEDLGGIDILKSSI